MECPTCFQKIIVPQSPATDDVALIITGSKARKQRVPTAVTNLGTTTPPKKKFPTAAIAFVILLCAAIAMVFVFKGKIFKSTGNQTNVQTNQTESAPVVTAAPVAAPALVVAPTPAATPAPAPVLPPVRIKAGTSETITDAVGNVWLPDQGFTGGDMYELPDAEITNSPTPAIYRTERYSMTAFSYPVPNGKYTVKLHFAEIYSGITGPGGRVFSFNVEGQEFNDFDIWVKAGGYSKAYVESVNVEVTDRKLNITFTPGVENPKICGIEILPRT